MAKLKTKQNGDVRLILKGDEIALVATLLNNVRLGRDSAVKEAAFRMLEAIDQSPEHCLDDTKISFAVSVEHLNGTRQVFDSTNMSYDVILELDDVEDESEPESSPQAELSTQKCCGGCKTDKQSTDDSGKTMRFVQYPEYGYIYPTRCAM